MQGKARTAARVSAAGGGGGGEPDGSTTDRRWGALPPVEYGDWPAVAGRLQAFGYALLRWPEDGRAKVAERVVRTAEKLFAAPGFEDMSYKDPASK